MTADSLPAELWSHVFECLDKLSLKNLSVVDHYLHSIAVPLLFDTISVHQSKAAQLHQVLAQKAYNKHIRKLEVRDRFEPTLHFDDAFSNPHVVYDYFADRRSPQESHTRDSSWEPVAALLASLPALTDLIWTCPQQFPRCLLLILHSDKFVGCKLHLRTFRLRSLALDEAAVDPHELELARSPNLHSVWFSCDLDNISNNDTSLPEAILCIARAAPNLRVLRLRQTIIQMTLMHPGLQPDVTMPRWASYLPNTEHAGGQLEQLQLTGPGLDLSPHQIVAWRDCTDFTLLRTLVLDIRIEEKTLVELANCKFASLVTLSMYLDIEPGMMSSPENREDTMSELARTFLCSLPPLKQLRLRGELDHGCLFDVLKHHANRIRKLELFAGGFSPHRLSLWPDEVLWVGDYCPALETLNLQMLRTRGDEKEVAAYSSLGSIPRLQTLLLTLDASDYISLRNDEGAEAPDWNPFPAPPKPHFDNAFDMEFAGFTDMGGDLDPRKGHLKDMFINAALDQSLVQAIFSKLSVAKPPRGLSFDRIEVKSVGGGDFGVGPIKPVIAEIMNEIQSSWVVEKSKVSNEQFRIRNISRDQSTSSRPEKNCSEDGIGRLLDSSLESIFRHVWPKSGEGAWRNDWYSLPLA